MNSLAQYLFSLYFSRCHETIYEDTYEYYENSFNNSFINKAKAEIEANSNIDYISIQSQNVFCDFHFNYSLQKDVTNIILEYSNTICLINSVSEAKCRLSNPKKEIHIVIFGDNNTIYYEHSNRLVPLSIKKFISFVNNFPLNVTFGKELLNNIFSFYRNINPFVNDIENTIIQDKFFIVPLTFNELLQYHSKKDLFINKYKTSSSININWNKRDMNVSYLIIKSWNMVAPEYRNSLLQIKKISNYSRIDSDTTYETSCREFLKGYILDNVNDEDIGTLVNDYVNMCRIAKEKIRINFRSVKSLHEAHDRLSEKTYMKNTPLVKIKKDTRFKKLRKILPDEFEWIKSRKRLIKETVMQHHCVWSYADKINKDTCQIYSYVNENGERFTLEFRVKRNKYVLFQIQGKYNQADCSEVSKYVCDILTAHQSTKIK